MARVCVTPMYVCSVGIQQICHARSVNSAPNKPPIDSKTNYTSAEIRARATISRRREEAKSRSRADELWKHEERRARRVDRSSGPQGQTIFTRKHRRGDYTRVSMLYLPNRIHKWSQRRKKISLRCKSYREKKETQRKRGSRRRIKGQLEFDQAGFGGVLDVNHHVGEE